MKIALRHLLPIVALSGCADLLSTTVDFSDQANAAVELAFDIDGDCTDAGELVDDRGVTRWTETAVGEGSSAACRIDVTWDGDLIDLAGMRADVIEECGADRGRCDPDALRLSLALRIDDAWFGAGSERLERSQLLAMTGRAVTGDAELFAIDRATVLPLEVGAAPAVTARLTAAYLAGGALPAHAESSLTLSMTDLVRLQAAASVGVLHIAFSSTLTGTIDAHL